MVDLEVSPAFEGLPTLVAPEVPLSGVAALVVFQGIHFCEGHPTLLTTVWFLFRVNAAMTVQVLWKGEGLVTLVTPVQVFSRLTSL